MSNTFLTPSLIAQETLMRLENNLVLGNLVNRDYSSEFSGNSGDTITVRKPITFNATDFDTEIEVQDIVEEGVPVKLDKLKDISFAISAKDLTLSIDDFGTRYLESAAAAMAQAIDEGIAKLALDIPYHVGTAGTVPGDVSSITALRKAMNDNKVPMNGRNLVLDTAADAKLLELDAFNRMDSTGTNAAIRDAVLGRKFGFDCYVDQNILAFSNGDLVQTAPKVSAAIDAGATTLTITDTTLTGTVKKGTLFTIAGLNQKFVVTADAVAAGNAASISFYPAVKEGVAANAAITIVSDHAVNMAFHKNAFALVSRPLAKPQGNEKSAQVNYNGLSVRVTFGYDIRKKIDICSIDTLVGFTTLTPELACVLLG